MDKAWAASSAPGRICLAGEDIDWISGPSILCAINQRTTVEVLSTSTVLNEDKIIFSSSGSIDFFHEVSLENIGVYEGHKSDYLNAALQVIIQHFAVDIESLHLKVQSNVPTSAGVSSSAAVLVATISALSSYYGLNISNREICHLAYIAENHELGTGVGQMDLYSCGLGGLIYINSSEVPPRHIESLLFPTEFDIILVDTLTPRKTGEVIQNKRKRIAISEPSILSYVRLTELAIEEMRSLLRSDNLDMKQIGELVSSCHSYLRDFMQVSTELLDECVARSLKMGAYGAKLTGTGMGGCMFAIADKANTNKIVNFLRDLPVKIYITSPTTDGAKSEY